MFPDSQLLSLLIPLTVPWLPVAIVFQFSSVAQSCPTLCDPMDCSTPGFPVHYQFPVFPSIRVFSSESVLCIRWPEYWGFSFSISPSSEYSGLLSLAIGPRVAAVWLLPLPFYWKYSKVSGDNKPLL